MSVRPQPWWTNRRTDSESDESGDEEQLEDVQIVVGPNPSPAVQQIMKAQFQEFAEGLPFEAETLRVRAMQGPMSGRTVVALSDCQILTQMSQGARRRSFGTTLHLGHNCTILCQVCSFSGSGRSCKKSWLCDFCHGQSTLQCHNKRKGSGAWQVSQLSAQQIIELYEAHRASMQQGSAEARLPAHPRIIAAPRPRRTWRTELRPPTAPRSQTWGGEQISDQAARYERQGRGNFRPLRPPQPDSIPSFQPRGRPDNAQACRYGQEPQEPQAPWLPASNLQNQMCQMWGRQSNFQPELRPQPWNQMPAMSVGSQSQMSMWL